MNDLDGAAEVALGILERRGPGGRARAVDDELRLRVLEQRVELRRRDLEIRPARLDDAPAVLFEPRGNVAAEKPGCARDEGYHRRTVRATP